MRTLRHFGGGLPPPLPATPPSKSTPLLTPFEWNGYCWSWQRPATQQVARMDVQSLCCILGRRYSGPSIASKTQVTLRRWQSLRSQERSLPGDIANPETMYPGPKQFSRRGHHGAGTLSEAKTGHKFTGLAAMPAWK